MRIMLTLPLPLWERLRERAAKDARPVKCEAVWLIQLALDYLEQEEARRQALGRAEAAGPRRHQLHRGGEVDAPKE